jgi:hypothetical protein
MRQRVSPGSRRSIRLPHGSNFRKTAWPDLSIAAHGSGIALPPLAIEIALGNNIGVAEPVAEAEFRTWYGPDVAEDCIVVRSAPRCLGSCGHLRPVAPCRCSYRQHQIVVPVGAPGRRETTPGTILPLLAAGGQQELRRRVDIHQCRLSAYGLVACKDCRRKNHHQGRQRSGRSGRHVAFGGCRRRHDPYRCRTLVWGYRGWNVQSIRRLCRQLDRDQALDRTDPASVEPLISRPPDSSPSGCSRRP